jgi:hypothetical protein
MPLPCCDNNGCFLAQPLLHSQRDTSYRCSTTPATPRTGSGFRNCTPVSFLFSDGSHLPMKWYEVRKAIRFRSRSNCVARSKENGRTGPILRSPLPPAHRLLSAAGLPAPFKGIPLAAGEHRFRDATSFDGVLELHIFDKPLRLLVMDAIERIEVSLRGAWAHHLAMKYGPHGYLDPGLYRRAVRYAQEFSKLMEDPRRSQDDSS